MRILGVDPGSRKTGFGILDVSADGRVLKCVEHGVFYLDVDTTPVQRLGELAHRLRELVDIYKPQRAIIEDVFMSNNPRSALILGQARGVVLGILGLEKISIFSYAPTFVKQQITGRGRADKKQVAHMVCAMLNLAKPPAEDAADALALAICGASSIRMPMLDKIPTAKRASAQKKRQALYELAKQQGKI